MFVTRFVCHTGPCEEYYYHKREDAEAHLNLFVGDDCGLYKSIVVVDEAENVLAELLF